MVRTCWTRPAGCDVGLVDLRRPENSRWDPSTCCPPGRPGIGPASRLKGLLPKRQRSSPSRSYYTPVENPTKILCCDYTIQFFFVLPSQVNYCERFSFSIICKRDCRWKEKVFRKVGTFGTIQTPPYKTETTRTRRCSDCWQTNRARCIYEAA